MFEAAGLLAPQPSPGRLSKYNILMAHFVLHKPNIFEANLIDNNCKLLTIFQRVDVCLSKPIETDQLIKLAIVYTKGDPL